MALLALGLCAGGARAAWAAAPGAGAAPEWEAPSAPGETFESAARGATRTNDVATLLAPFFETCEVEAREIDRTRCLASRGYLREILPARTFLISVDDPAAIAVSDYDAGIKGYRLALSGCVACSKPITVGRASEPRFITLKTPQKGVTDSLAGAVEIARNAVGFEGLVEAKRWLAEVRPTLRAEFVFKPAESEWTLGTARGYALELLAARIYNRCTGEVVMSRPPSTGLVEPRTPGEREAGCAPARAKAAAAGESGGPGGAEASDRHGGAAGDGSGSADDQLPPELSKSAIAESMGQIRAQIFACYQQFQVPGNVQLTYVIAGNGSVQAIRVSGSLDGTPTAACVLDAGKNARFPRSQAATQTFSYPFFLRR
jgi:hypothetical protein